MYRISIIMVSLFLSVIFMTCEEPTGPDTTPPTVTITNPQSGSTVSEIVTITCVSFDNKGVEKVELWVDGVTTGLVDDTEPYSVDWNTTTYEDRSYTITVRSYDVNDNKSDSEPITLTVDNSGSYPQLINIISIVFGNGNLNVTWNQSTDGDFSSYDLEKSDQSTMSDYNVVYSTENVKDTTYVDSDVDPLSYQYYRITVIDTFGYETKGQIVSSSLDPVPTSVNVTSVNYTLDEMTITWEESKDGDFESYKLLYSETESGDKDTIITYTDKSDISHTITEFDPTKENWFWVLVTDTLDQSSLGNGMTSPWTKKADMPTGRWELSTCVVDGKIYAIGGAWPFYQALRTVEVYNPATDTWTTKSEMPTARQGLSTSVVNGKIYAIGGGELASVSFTSVETFSTVEEYDPATDTWTTKSPMPTSRGFHSANVVDGRIYVIGGSPRGPDQSLVRTVEVYDPTTDTWTTKGDMPRGIGAGFSSEVDGKIYVFGGYGGARRVDEYDPATDTWTRKSDMPTSSRIALSTSALDGKIYAIGGYVPGVSGYPGVTTVEVYNPATDNWWTEVPDMPTGRFGPRSSVVDGKIYVIGGMAYWIKAAYGIVEEYDPEKQ